MAGGIGISLLIDSPLRDLTLSIRALPKDMRTQIGRATKAEAKPIWFSELKERADTRLQQRVLVNSADVSVTARNITLKSGGRGKLSSGTPVAVLAYATEFGSKPNRPIVSKSRKGKEYTRTQGNTFKAFRRGGYVVFPAASDSIPRFVSLWAQTARRTIHESIEEV